MEARFDEATTQLLRAASSQLPVASKAVTVLVVEGPTAGLRVVFDDLAHRQAFVGQSATCDVRLADPTVSRRHVGLRLSERGVVLEDLESSNGTTVNQVLVDRAVLLGGELVRIGSSGLRIEIGTEAHTLPASEAASFGGFVGASAAARRLYLVLERFVHVDTSLLLEGEPGTGKELLAETIHETGPRRGGPFVVLDPLRGTPQEVERALFGHESGGEIRPGLLERARGGTLFIDEVGDLEPPLQIKLLRAIETRTARRIDGRESYAIDVRYVAATRRNLDRDVHARRFREELLAFLAPGRVDVPALRHRRGDITLLTKVFWTRFGGDVGLLSPALVQRFEEHRWSGNVRELIAVVAQQLVDGGPSAPFESTPLPADERPRSDASDGDDFIQAILRRGLPYASARQHVATAFETRYLAYMLDLHKGNVTKAADASGMSRRHYHRLIAKG